MAGHQRRRNAVFDESRVNTDNEKRRIKGIFSYDGTSFKGYQSQKRFNSTNSNPSETIQDYIENKLFKLYNRRICIFSSGRTDKGVHANAAVCHFDLYEHEIFKRFGRTQKDFYEIVKDGEKMKENLKLLRNYLNKPFPVKDIFSKIRFEHLELVRNDFDARFSVKFKRYQYNLCFDEAFKLSPYLSRYCWNIADDLKMYNVNFDEIIKKLGEILEVFNGEHNFRWISVVQENEQRDSFRKLCTYFKVIDANSCQLTFNDNVKIIQIFFECDFFLYKMVRRLIGLIVNILLRVVDINLVKLVLNHFDSIDRKVASKLTTSEMNQMIQTLLNNNQNLKSNLDSVKVGDIISTAPSKGLFLNKVIYGEEYLK